MKLKLKNGLFLILVCSCTACWGQKMKPLDSVLMQIADLKANVRALETKLDGFYGTISDSLMQVPEKLNAQLTQRNLEMTDSIVNFKIAVEELNTQYASVKNENASYSAQIAQLKSANTKAWTTLAESTYKNMAVVPSSDIDLIIQNTDAKTGELLSTFKTQSEILKAAQKLLYEGTDKSKYTAIQENLKKTIDPKFTAQCSLQTKLLNEFELFEEIARELNRIIEKLKTNTSENYRTTEMEKYSYTHELDYYPWLYEIYKKNKSKHTAIGITFE